jgi:hypothetical protein
MICSSTRSLVATLAVASLLMSTGCAEQREAVDRVQPFALDKTLFVGEDLVDPSDNPEFWTQGTLIDVGYGAAQSGLFTSTYAQPMTRIKWKITEDLLMGRLAYERIANSDGKGLGTAIQDGPVVVTYRIEKHFDISRAYNPTTGERLNILEENAIDRPWNEREYMRVDWSRNLNTDAYDFDTLSLLGVYGGVTYEPLAYDVTDENDPNAPFFDLENAYFDVTNKAFAQPEIVDLSHLGWGIDSFPACFLPADFMGGTAPAGNCNPVELTIRQSFRKVVDTDYEPVHWDGRRFQSFGGFYVERYGYARNYGMSDEMWHRFLTRYQIWQRAHYYDDPETMSGPVECYTPETTPFGSDPHRDFDRNATDDECEQVGLGSKCDTFRQRCTLPFADRETLVIPWYYTNAGYQDLYDGTEMAAHEWDVALRISARTAQYAECQATGQSGCLEKFPLYFGQQDDNLDAVQLAREVDDCRNGLAYFDQDCNALADTLGAQREVDSGVIAIAKMPEMIVLCHSPVQAEDHPACGELRLPVGTTAADCHAAEQAGEAEVIQICKQALTVRQGDLRYHQVNVHDKPQTPSPWGIYTDAEDPLTGQTISASINTWAHVNDLFSQAVIDKIRLIKGELQSTDVTEGDNVMDWAAAAEAAASSGVAGHMTRAQLVEKVARFTGGDAATIKLQGEIGEHDHEHVLPAHVRQAAAHLKHELSSVRSALGEASVHTPTYTARRNAARGTELEASLLTPMVQQLVGIAGMPMSDSILNIASPLRGANPSLQRDLFNLREMALADRGACILNHPSEALAPISLTGLADTLEEKFGRFNPNDPPAVQQERAERMRRFISHRAQYAVIVHEMGHSIGLRHNFVSSSDAWGYRPQYWQLRTRDGTETQRCTDLAADGEDCVGPRYFDPVTSNEQKNLIWMFMHSSVMDYPGELTQDMLGLGVWDFAAARMFYGDMVAVHADEAYATGKAKGYAMLSKMDNFGGILGIQPGRWNALQQTIMDFHYSDLQNEYQLISDCRPVSDLTLFKPARWNTERDGSWHALLDGLIVQVDGQWTRCRQEKVDYVPWSTLRMPIENELPGYYGGGPSIDHQNRIRMPYGFATDGWADLGNLSVYRHDNGADAYEIFNFFITQQEVNHIFDNYRRGRTTFSVRKAANRTLRRFNEKLRDGAKGLGLMKNVYRDFALEIGYDFDTLWPYIAGEFFGENILASGMAFDHFSRQFVRPEIGEHYLEDGDPVLRSARDAIATPGPTKLIVPNGATGLFGDIGLGGKAVENMLADDQGEYDRDYTINCGSYYDKLNTAMLMTESVDNFISSSRRDFVDPRYRAVSLADLFPDGYRRFLANMLTGDDWIKAPRVVADANGIPQTDVELYPATPIGWTTWWGDEPRTCFPAAGTMVCDSYSGTGEAQLNPLAPAHTAPIDPQVGWEQHKFLIAWTLGYLPENERMDWLDMMHLWEMGRDADPGFANRIEFYNPTGKTYVAKTFGKETIMGKSVQRGISARVLEYANDLLVQAYETTDGPDLDGDGIPDWYLPIFNPDNGLPIVRFDAGLDHIRDDGTYLPGQGSEGCNPNDNTACTCASNRWCVKLKDYVTLPAYLREALDAYRLGDPEERGVY